MGSNDSDSAKKNPITVRHYDVNSDRVVTCFLNMCTSTSGTAAGIYAVMDTKLVEFLKPMKHVHFSWC